MSYKSTHLEVETDGSPQGTKVTINGDRQNGIAGIYLTVDEDQEEATAVVSFSQPKVTWTGPTRILTTIDGHEYELRPIGGPLQPNRAQEAPRKYQPIETTRDSDPWRHPEQYDPRRSQN